MIKRLCVCSIVCLFFSSCYVYRAYRSRNFYLKDLPRFTTQTVQKSSAPYYFKTNLNEYRYLPMRNFLDTLLANSQTYSFTVIKNDTILYDKYFDGLSSQNIFPSFSVAKSFVGTLVQIAYQEGYIKNYQEPITHYLPYLLKRDKRFADITIQHLLDMRSGIKSNENYNSPFADVIKMGFRKNIEHQLKRLKIKSPTGQFEYISINTQLLAMVVQKATGKKLYAYLQEKLWQPLGMEADATWLIDSKKHDNVRAFCCLNAVAHDFAKLGRLYLHKGNWNGLQILNSAWVNASVSPDSMFKYDEYKNQWWGSSITNRVFDDSISAANYVAVIGKPTGIGSYTRSFDNQKFFTIPFPYGDYHAEGILGQYIYVDPVSKVIVVRTGHYWNTKGRPEESIFRIISWQAATLSR